jgi:hypothetical protein
MRMMTVLALAAALAGCSISTCLYDWGGYEDSLFRMQKPEFSPQKEAQILSAEIDKTLSRGRQVPPGKFATLGYFYYRCGDRDAARASFEREKELYPESAWFIDGMVRRMP